jgi:hypothetical protein
MLRAFHAGIDAMNRIHPDYRCEILNRDDFFQLQGYGNFFEKWKSGQKHALIKDFDFIKWRTGAPETAYHFIIVREENEIIGMAIARKAVLQNIPVIAVLDMMILDGKFDCRALISRSLMKLAAKFQADAVVTMMSKFWARRYRMNKIGFIRSPYKFSLIIKKLNPAIDDAVLHTESNWHLMWMDSDDL